ncbi:NTP transferase domain-containing protein [Chitinimonas sp.]|uniref:nucleotidyltransferase family protein n=1 Tax=Chitinimonas sp. TaxID=1934313 RepID=UPI0035B03420
MAEWVGILLAAGSGRRFDPSGKRLKLLQLLPDGTPIAVASARALLGAMPRVLAMVPADDSANTLQLSALLTKAGCVVLPCPASKGGMGNTVAAAIAASADTAGWLLLPADMPWLTADSCQRVLAALQDGHMTAAPVCAGQRGHPVGFSAGCRDALLAVQGEQGARSVLLQYPPTLVDVVDHGVLLDVDGPDDLAQHPARS